MRTPKFHDLKQSPFFRLRSPDKMAAIVGSARRRLDILSTTADSLYSEFDIEPKPGKKRHIEEPLPGLKVVQARIASLLARIRPADYLYCPAKRRCYVANAAQHRHNRVVHCLDITKFFPSTPRRRVYTFFTDVMECAPDVAGRLAGLATFNGHLPTGSPLSPIMAHYAYTDVWQALAQIAKEHDLTLTVYVDDVTVSGQHVPECLVWEMKKIIYASGLRYHKEKRYVDRPADVTGVILRDGNLLVPNRQHLKQNAAKVSITSAADEATAFDAAARLRGLKAQEAHIAKFRNF